MSDAQKNETDRQNKSAAAIAALDSSEQGTAPAAAAAAPTAKPKEKVGLGEDTAKKTAKALAAKMKARIARERAAGNTSLADRLAANRAQLLKDAGL